MERAVATSDEVDCRTSVEGHASHWDRFGYWSRLFDAVRGACEGANRAMRDGKALLRLHEQLFQVKGVEDMRIEEPDSPRGTSDPNTILCVRLSAPSSAEARYRVSCLVRETNRRFGSAISVRIHPES